MKNASFSVVCLLAGLFLLATSCEKEVKIADLPASIQAWISANHPGFTADEAEKEVLCDGTNVFEVEAEKGKDEELKLTFDTNGTFLFSQSEVAVADLPTAVSAGAAKKYAGKSISEAVKMAMADGSTRYEVELGSGKSEKEVVFDNEGIFICEEGQKP